MFVFNFVLAIDGSTIDYGLVATTDAVVVAACDRRTSSIWSVHRHNLVQMARLVSWHMTP